MFPITTAAWLSLGAALIAWIALQTADYHWLGTLVAFGPRWVLLLPVGILAVVAMVWKPWVLVPVAIAAAVILGPVMGFCVPWRKWAASGVSGAKIKVLTCNTLQGHADGRLEALIEREEADVVVLQEWPSQRPAPEMLQTGWQIARDGQMVVASRWPITASEPLYSPTASYRTIGLRCKLELPNGPVQVFGLHLLTPRDGLEAVLHKMLGGMAELEEVTERRRLDGEAAASWIATFPGPKLVAGDLNLTPESTIYRREFGSLQNAFSTAGFGWGGTKHTRIHSVRIDHILADDAWQCQSCKVGPNVGSDHRPLIAEFATAPPAPR